MTLICKPDGKVYYGVYTPYIYVLGGRIGVLAYQIRDFVYISRESLIRRWNV